MPLLWSRTAGRSTVSKSLCTWTEFSWTGWCRADKVVLDMVPLLSTDCLRPGSSTYSKRHQALTVFVRDDLIDGVQIGGRYSVIGIPAYESSANDGIRRALEANNITNLSILDAHLVLPEKIALIYQDRMESPWSFGLSMAYIFAGEVTPPGSFLYLKLILLLCLFRSPRQPKMSLLCLLVLAGDWSLVSRLLDYCATFGTSGCVRYHAAGHHLTAKVNADKYTCGQYFMEGGSLLLAADGVCLLGDIKTMTKKTRDSLQNVLESGQVQVAVPSKYTIGLGDVRTCPTRCSVWALAETGLSPCTLAHTPERCLECQTGKDAAPLAEKFSLVYSANGDDEQAELCDVMMSQHLLTRAMQLETTDIVSQDEFRTFLALAATRDPTFSQAAQTLICQYYVISRRCSLSATHGALFPISAIETLTSLSYAHARLNLRDVVSVEDAVMAIYMFELTIIARTGSSPLGVQSIVHVGEEQTANYLGKKHDQKMGIFQSYLLSYCSDKGTGRIEE